MDEKSSNDSGLLFKNVARDGRVLKLARQAQIADVVSRIRDFITNINWSALATTVATTASSLASTLSGPLATLGSGVQYAFMGVGIVYLIVFVAAIFYPGLNILPLALGLGPITPFFRSLGDAVSKIEVGRMIRALEAADLPETSFNYLDIKEPDCRRRAVCEAGEMMAKRFPTIVRYFGISLSVFPGMKKYAEALLNGANTNHTQCQLQYPTCSYSPLKRLGLS
ncbi:uncharacterized protein LOC143243977 isoform X2 [Tachypleus tridentatus]|uniref:uncharacterized protein LOC143243977 isoform X2 n=1 Tax=Tachypleus tridentatus TaxID=6853 RepID=UPI003FD231BE